MTLRKQITEDLKTAMKAGDAHKRDTLRSLDSMIKNEEIAQKKREEGLDDVTVVTLVKRAIKQRKDSATQFRTGNRDDLAEKEDSEINVLMVYLPAQMNDDDVRRAVEKVIAEIGATSRADMGKVMGIVMSEIGDNADGNTVRSVVDTLLS